MKKKIAALAAGLASVLILAWCATHKVETEESDSISPKTSRFINIEKSFSWSVVYDRETKVMYTVSNHGIFTLLVDQNGDPILYGDAQE